MVFETKLAQEYRSKYILRRHEYLQYHHTARLKYLHTCLTMFENDGATFELFYIKPQLAT